MLYLFVLFFDRQAAMSANRLHCHLVIAHTG